ncbi:hypothetical protein SLS56_001979 [Neofusicoccum ribis]|uniref:Protein kinase domain-containing protein n=1 Tax=Neofusicoccum ribis TaxID=45134 RepID=A0ABR3T5Q3_9PEZI
MCSPFFRSPLEDTSSAGDTSSGSEDDKEESSDHLLDPKVSLDAPGNVYDLARVRSAASTSVEEISRSFPSNYAGGQAVDHRDGLLHAVLEQNCLYRALEELNANPDPKRGRPYTKEDPEVRARGRAKFLEIASNLAAHGISNSGLHRDEFRPLRENYNQALDAVRDQGDGALEHFRNSAPTRNVYRSSSTLELSNHANDDETSPAHRSHVRLGPLPPDDQLDILKSIVGPRHPLLPHSFSMASFYNLRIIGKGGYGTVFSGYNPIDGGSYAIKQVPLSAARIRNIQRRGHVELDTLLKEVRAMQGFDHPNIVRYHSAWLERPSDNMHHLVKTDRKLLELGSTTFPTDTGSSDAPATTSGLEQTFDSRLNLSAHDDGIVFGEDSLPGHSAQTDYHLNVPRKRRESHLTASSPAKSEMSESEFGEPAGLHKQARKRRESHTTLSSSVSKKSFVHSTDGELDEEVEMIPRDFSNLTRSGPREDSFDMNIVFEDDYDARQHHRPDVRTPRSSDLTQIGLALHIQMALYPMTLAEYLKVEPDYVRAELDGTSHGETVYRHCFHVKPSLQVLLAILDGVQYLHAHNMVHRDLKPANIFLSPCEQAYRHKSHVHIGVCKECAKAGQCKDLQLGVRIGDFGLVTELTHLENSQHHGPEKAVGTEFYRPPVPAGQPTEKLDVFSLGVIAFELLWKFDTKSERIHTLSELKLGRLPSLFILKMEGYGTRLSELIKGMLHSDEHNRLTCLEVQQELEAIIAGCDA